MNSWQVFAGLGLTWSPGAERPVAMLVDSSLLDAAGQGVLALERGGFVQVRFAGTRHFHVAAGGVLGVASVQRSDRSYWPYAQGWSEVGARLGSDGLWLHVGAGLSKSGSPHLVQPQTSQSTGLEAFQLAVRGHAAWRPGTVTGGADLAVRVGWRSQVWVDGPVVIAPHPDPTGPSEM